MQVFIKPFVLAANFVRSSVTFGEKCIDRSGKGEMSFNTAFYEKEWL